MHLRRCFLKNSAQSHHPGNRARSPQNFVVLAVSERPDAAHSPFGLNAAPFSGPELSSSASHEDRELSTPCAELRPARPTLRGGRAPGAGLRPPCVPHTVPGTPGTEDVVSAVSCPRFCGHHRRGDAAAFEGCATNASARSTEARRARGQLLRWQGQVARAQPGAARARTQGREQQPSGGGIGQGTARRRGSGGHTSVLPGQGPREHSPPQGPPGRRTRIPSCHGNWKSHLYALPTGAETSVA